MSKQDRQVSWAEAVQNIVFKAMANGWLGILILPGFFLGVFWLVPDKDKRVLVENILKLHLTVVGGWALAVGAGIGWRFHVKWLSSKYDDELDRQSKQKTDLQKQLTKPGDIKTSKK